MLSNEDFIRLMTHPDRMCLNDPELWFSHEQKDMEQAVAFCQQCPVREECLAWGLLEATTSQRMTTYGIYGGHTPDERIAMLRKEIKKDEPKINAGSDVVRRYHRDLARRAWARRQRAADSPGDGDRTGVDH